MTLHRRYEITRLEAFSDAVFAFALTLPVVSLEVPHSYQELMTLVRGFVPFACCFALLVWIWYEHSAFFTKYPLHDRIAVVLNAALLFVVLFYVYPLKFMFDSMFAQFVAVPGLQRMSLSQLSRASVIYGFGFFVMFLLFALLYRHAYNKRDELGLTPADVLDVKIFAGHHLVSATVGLISVAVALLAPAEMTPLAPAMFGLMGPLHWMFGISTEKRRKKFGAAQR